MRMFAAIDVGSSELSMKIYEISKKNGMREVDHTRYIIELGSDTYSKGMISFELVNELCDVLQSFKLKMQEYRVDEYLAYASSAMREAGNCELIIDQVRVKTGLEVQIIDNSRQHFLVLKSLASQMVRFEELIQEGAAIVDMGSGSLQVSVYEKGRLSLTQNIRLGSLRIREILSTLEGETTSLVNLMEDFISNDIETFKRTVLQDREINNIIAIGEEIAGIFNFINNMKNREYVNLEQFDKIYNRILKLPAREISSKYNVPYEVATILPPTLIVYKNIIKETNAHSIWVSSTSLCDGIAVDYTEHKEGVGLEHSFDEDIVCLCRSIARKYRSNIAHIENVEKLALVVFDALKKKAGLTNRDRLLLQLACILHDCGKFVDMKARTQVTYQLIMATELVGISVAEKRIVAKAVRYNSSDTIPSFSEMHYEIDKKSYMTMLKLSAILRLANGMDRSHKQKIQNIKVSFKNQEMIIRADTIYDITLEYGLIEMRANFIEEIFGMKPVLKQKRGV